MPQPREAVLALKEAVSQSIIAQETLVEHLVIALLCNGNVLVEGLPGTAKTRSIKTLAQALAADFGRIQFTPDLLPSDVTGTEVLQDEGDRRTLKFQPGPLFNNLVLADEINRAPAKVQSALLEAMEERQVTAAGTTYQLPELFMVLATQNPIEQEGTYPLPEAQMDRFLLKLKVEYPDEAGEKRIIRLVRGEEETGQLQSEGITQQSLFDARDEVHNVHIAESIEDYIVALVMATRHPERYSDELGGWLDIGSSPRASIALDRCSRAHAWLRGQDYVDPDDVRAVLMPVMRHRIMLSYEAQADGVQADDVLAEIVRQVAVA